MKKIILLSAFIFLSIVIKAQDDMITVGQKHTIHSHITDEDRTYFIYLPNSYNKTDYGKATYPVIYVLDGENNFLTAVAIQKTFTRGMYNNMPECIIIGVINTNRTRDLTPSKSVWEHNGKKLFTDSGGGENFTVFLTKELRQYIDTTYRTNGYNILVGHSFGGLFTMNTLVHHTKTFNAYIVLDPSLWWDNRKVYAEAQKMWNTTDFEQRSLYIAMAKNEDKPGEDQKHSATIKEFCDSVLLSAPDNNLNVNWKYFESEDHGTILMPGIYDAFRTIFEGITLPVKKIPGNPQIILKEYDKLSQKLGHTFIPDETLLDNIGNYAITVGEKDGAKQIFEYEQKYYPDSNKAQENLMKLSKSKLDSDKL